MPDLEMLLRDVRPVPDADWAARLDKRPAAGFPGPFPRRKKALRSFRNHFAAWSLAAATAATLLVIVLVGVRVQHGSSDDAMWSSASAPAPLPETASKSSGGAGSSAADSAAPLARDQAAGAAGEDRA